MEWPLNEWAFVEWPFNLLNDWAFNEKPLHEWAFNEWPLIQ